MDAGAAGIHVHPRNAHGLESLDDEHVSSTISAVRHACPGLPVGISTGAWIEPDLVSRLELIEGWSELPDYASVNVREEGALRVIDLLLDHNIEVEAGVWDENDARFFIDNGLDSACLRVLVEVDSEAQPARAVHLARSIDAVLDDGLCEAPRLHHGSGAATWAVLHEAADGGHDVRVGLEDTLVLPDGMHALGNRELIEVLVRIARASGRSVASR